MASVEEALKTQIRNIEARSGKSMKEWKAAMFSHRVRVATSSEIDAQLKSWLKAAYTRAA